MNIENTIVRLNRIEDDPLIQNFIAQANSRYILLNTSENPENYPPYTIKDESLNLLAFYYLNLGCSLAEAQEKEKFGLPLEKGASILEYIHGSQANKHPISNYYGLIASLAYYICFQYSKSFILIKKLDSKSVISRLLYLFLQRDYKRLTVELDKIFVDINYSDTNISQDSESRESDCRVYEFIIAKALDGFINFAYTGNDEFLIQAKKVLKSLKEIAELKNDPGIWWIIRLLLLISDSYEEASLWNALKGYFSLEDSKVQKYIYSLTNLAPTGIFELFITQRKSLPKLLDSENKGCIVSIPTSSGKTRIAEIAILDSLIKNPESKVLYIAPFVSLAFEIENSLGNIFNNLKYNISQLYGGNFYSKLDEKVIEESQIIIATPEKSKAILRGNREILEQIKLIVVDEGHLLGPDKRLIINEIFYEELRYSINKNGGKFLLLSAVLPNSEELAEWLASTPDCVYKDSWRPSDERLGMLEWTGTSANIEWESSDTERQQPFNKQFIKKGKQENSNKLFPKNKNEAIAATAYKFKPFGKVLIFVGKKDSVFTMAKAYLDSTDGEIDTHVWKNQSDWESFELACTESYGELENNLWLKYARKGILCHNANLCSDVRLPIERLMRNDSPLVIISTSTLGQGVNLGVSTVIFSTLYQNRTPLTHRDFWNIAGRAGRAFIDHEGKILVAIDASKRSNSREINKIKYTRQQVKAYFDKEKIDQAKSGILILIKVLKSITGSQGISFELLIQLIAENKLKDIGEEAVEIEEALDWIDDSLLSLHNINNEVDEIIDYSWVEEYFRKSLAFIQASKETVITGDEVLAFIQARVQGIVERVGTNRSLWKSIINSGIPLSSDLIIEDRLSLIIEEVNYFYESDYTSDALISLLKSIEELISDIPILKEEGENIISEEINSIREKWFKGESLSRILPHQNSQSVISKYYTYKLPWILNGIAKKLRYKDFHDEAVIIEELSILVEAGLPNIESVKVYQAGIRSRRAAEEIGHLFENDIWNKSINDYKKELLNRKEYYISQVSNYSAQWIELLSNSNKERMIKEIPNIEPFTYGNVNKETRVLVAREINGIAYLVSPDKSFIQDVNKSDINFTSVCNIPGITFNYNVEEDLWHMQNQNPYISIKKE